MKTRVPVLVLALGALVLAGCPSKDHGSSSGATQPSGAPPMAGPLAQLEGAQFMNEVWTSQEGQQMPFIFYGRENVRLSAQCRQNSGQLACDAVRQLRNAPQVVIQKRELTGNTSAGTRVCQKLGHKLVSGHNAQGSEDGFCRFPDGSMVSTGALEQYAMHVNE